MPKIHILRSLGAFDGLSNPNKNDKKEINDGQLKASTYPENVYSQVLTNVESVKRG